jgi:hypothetical protein
MNQQGKSNSRNRSRRDASRNTRPAQAGQNEPHAQSQWQRKYDHHRGLAQAANRDDAVTCEQHWQYAEHFLRLINGSAT